MMDEAHVGKALHFEGLELPEGERLFVRLGIPPTDFSLSALLEKTHSREARLDVLPEVLNRWLSSPISGSRSSLALVWEKALLNSPNRIGLSLSHTGELVVTAARTSNGVTASVGIDIELADRQVPDRVCQRIFNDGDRVPLYPIALWSFKEAVFKAALDLRPSFRDICIDLPKGMATCPGGKFRIALLEEQGAYIAIAIAKRLASTGD